MKKNILILFSILVCFQQIKAQDPTIIRIYETMPEEIAKTESTHTIDIGLVGAGYTYEYAFAKKFTLNLRTGITGSVGYTSSDLLGSYWFYSFHPYVNIEPRYYYNLQRVLRKGNSIEGNSGAFFAVQCAYILKPFVQHNVDFNKAVFAVAPYWGARKVFKHHFLLEFQLGWVYGFSNYSDSDAGVHCGFRFGYMF